MSKKKDGNALKPDAKPNRAAIPPKPKKEKKTSVEKPDITDQNLATETDKAEQEGTEKPKRSRRNKK